MAKSTRRRLQKLPLIRSVFLVWALFFCYPYVYAYTDQIWLKSPSLVKTVFDVKVHALLRNLYDNRSKIDPDNELWQRAHLSQERKSLLEQVIVFQYVKDNRVGIEIATFERINARKKITLYFDSANAQKQFFSAWGITEYTMQQWIEQRLTLEKFLQTHPPFQAIVTDRKIARYYQEHKQKRFLNRKLADIRNLVIEDYKKMYLQIEFKKWLDQEIRRQKWVVYE